eukprot:GHVU01129422.1.p1 GENE.GHVU01129422.1~~GHVU01129422.1.p1  ORF type:complete len:778 (+),score=99.52 GHVU01129422.1:861-3194(+)
MDALIQAIKKNRKADVGQSTRFHESEAALAPPADRRIQDSSAKCDDRDPNSAAGSKLYHYEKKDERISVHIMKGDDRWQIASSSRNNEYSNPTWYNDAERAGCTDREQVDLSPASALLRGGGERQSPSGGAGGIRSGVENVPEALSFQHKGHQSRRTEQSALGGHRGDGANNVYVFCGHCGDGTCDCRNSNAIARVGISSGDVLHRNDTVSSQGGGGYCHGDEEAAKVSSHMSADWTSRQRDADNVLPAVDNFHVNRKMPIAAGGARHGGAVIASSAAATTEGNFLVTPGPLAAPDGMRSEGRNGTASEGVRPYPPGQELLRLLKGGGGSTSGAVREGGTQFDVRGCAVASLRTDVVSAPPLPPAVAGSAVVHRTVDGKGVSIGRKNDNVDWVCHYNSDGLRINNIPRPRRPYFTSYIDPNVVALQQYYKAEAEPHAVSGRSGKSACNSELATGTMIGMGNPPPRLRGEGEEVVMPSRSQAVAAAPPFAASDAAVVHAGRKNAVAAVGEGTATLDDTNRGGASTVIPSRGGTAIAVPGCQTTSTSAGGGGGVPIIDWLLQGGATGGSSSNHDAAGGSKDAAAPPLCVNTTTTTDFDYYGYTTGVGGDDQLAAHCDGPLAVARSRTISAVAREGAWHLRGGGDNAAAVDNRKCTQGGLQRERWAQQTSSHLVSNFVEIFASDATSEQRQQEQQVATKASAHVSSGGGEENNNDSEHSGGRLGKTFDLLLSQCATSRQGGPFDAHGTRHPRTLRCPEAAQQEPGRNGTGVAAATKLSVG